MNGILSRVLASWTVAVLAAVGLATVPGCAVAQVAGDTRLPADAPTNQRDTLTVTSVDALVVTVTRRYNAVGDVPADVSVITRRVIEASAARTLPDLLRKIPGFTLRDYLGGNAAHASRQAPALRGLAGGSSAGRTLILLDGVPVNDPWAGWVHWARIPLDLVERVEVVRSGGSGIWGNRALGGVINIVTRRPQETGGQLTLSAGNLSTIQATGSGTYKQERVGVALAGEFLDSEGYIAVRSDQRGPIDEPAGPVNGSLYGKFEYEVSSDVGLHLHANYFNESRDFGTPLRTTGTELWYLRGGATVSTSELSELEIIAFGSGQSFESFFTTEAQDRETETPALDQFDVPAVSAGGSVQWSTRALSNHELAAGADVLWVDGEVNEDFFYLSGDFLRRRRVGGQQLLTGFYIQDLARLGPKWNLLGSVRLDIARNTNGFRKLTNLGDGSVLTDTAFASLTESTLNFSLGAKHDLAERVSVRAQIHRAYRAPTLNELYKPFREPGNVITEANTDLAAERTFGAEAGLDYAVGQSLFVRLTGFWTRVENPVIEATVEKAGDSGRPIAPCGFVPAGGVCRQRQNIESLESAGVEGKLEFYPARNWLLIGSYLWNPTEITGSSINPELEGNASSRTPKQSLTLISEYANPKVLDVSLTGRWIGSRFEDDLNSLELASFFVLDGRIARAIGPRLAVSLSVENIFDTEYEATRSTTGLVRIGAPRSVLAGLRLRF